MTDLFSTECNSALRAGPARPPGTGRGTTRESEWRLWEPSGSPSTITKIYAKNAPPEPLERRFRRSPHGRVGPFL